MVGRQISDPTFYPCKSSDFHYSVVREQAGSEMALPFCLTARIYWNLVVSAEMKEWC